jgi:DNA excision repair protein ERCC-2
MGEPTDLPLELPELIELVHSTCSQVISTAGYLHRAGLTKALRSLGWALGMKTASTDEASRGGARGRASIVDSVWTHEGSPAVAVAVDGELRLSRALALLDTGAKVGLLVVASGLGDAWRRDLEAFRRAALPSREGALASSGVHVVLLNLTLEDDEVVESAGAAAVRHFALGDLLGDEGWEGGKWLSEIVEPSSSVSLGPGASDNVDREAYPLFPHDRVRKGQRRFLDDVHAAVEDGSLLVAHAPTGIGKTVSALVPTVQHAIASGALVLFLTPKQSQHRIAIETLRRMDRMGGQQLRVVDVIAKQAMCPRVRGDEHYAAFHEFCLNQVMMGRCRLYNRSNAAVVKGIQGRIMHVHELVALAKRARVCPHRAALDAAAGAHVVVCDYNYVFMPELSDAIISRLERGWEDVVLIVDEAHNLPDRARDAASGALSEVLIERAGVELSGEEDQLKRMVSRLGTPLEGAAEDVDAGVERDVDPQVWVGAVEAELASSLEPMGYDDLVEELKEAGRRLASGDELSGSSVTELARFLEGFPRGGDSVLRTVSTNGGPRLAFRLLDPSFVTRDRFSEVHAGILMSGTLWPSQMYADLMGLAPGRTRLAEYRSPFPPENRLVRVTRGLTTKYTARGPEMFTKLAEAVEEVLEATPGNVAVFTPSYELLNQIRSGLEGRGGGPKELLVEERRMGKRDRERLCDRLEELRSSEGGALLGVQGGSLSEGVDYLENLLSAVVVVGLPLAPPSREVEALIAYFDRKFGRGRGEEYGYVNPAMNRVVQAAGRLIRTEQDRGVVVLMDERFLSRRYLRCFPPDWEPLESEGLGVEISRFFEGSPAG